MANRILVVEDDKAISDFIAGNLQYTGYDYAVFPDGARLQPTWNRDPCPMTWRCWTSCCRGWTALN